MVSTYHFVVPNTKVEYTVRLSYENNFIRGFHVDNLVRNGRPVTENDIPNNELDLYLKHLSNKINNVSLIKK